MAHPLLLVLTLTIAVGQVLARPAEPARQSGVTPQPASPRTGSVSPRAADRSGTRIYAVGSAVVLGGNVSSARQAALQSAYAEAVARGAGVEIGRMTLIRNVQAVSDVVASRSRGHIRSYEIVGEGLTEATPATYEVRISADVVHAADTPADDVESLKLYLDVIGRPRLLVLLPESAFVAPAQEGHLRLQPWGSDAPATPAGLMRNAEAAIAQAFGRYGYSVLTSDDVSAGGVVTAEQLARARRGVTADAAAVAQAVGVDLLLAGHVQLAWQRVSPQGVEFVSATTVAAAKAIVVSNGHVVEAFNRSTTKAHTSALGAITSSLQTMADDVATALAWKIPSILASRPRITRLVFERVDLQMARRLKTGLESLEGIDTVRMATIPTQSRPIVELELLSGYVLLPQEELVSRCESVVGAPVRVVEADRFHIRFAVG